MLASTSGLVQDKRKLKRSLLVRDKLARACPTPTSMVVSSSANFTEPLDFCTDPAVTAPWPDKKD
jgi:hypothetical protein